MKRIGYVILQGVIVLNRKWMIISIFSFGFGNTLIALSRIFREFINEFTLGFCDGVSIVSVLLGVAGMLICISQRKKCSVKA